ncbi:MAG: CBS domain-containing protein [Alphaproteobacteria bacterium]
MLCKGAISGKSATATEDTSVEDALAMLKKGSVEALVVTDAAGKPAGIFSIAILLKNLLPVSVPVEGIEMNMTVSAAPGIAKRLKNMALLPVSAIMERKVHTVPDSAQLWEGIQILLAYKMPVLVVDPETGKATGIMTAQSAFEELDRLKESA